MLSAPKFIYPPGKGDATPGKDDSAPALSASKALCIAFTVTAPHGFAFDGMVHRGDRPDRTAGHAFFARIGRRDDNTMRVTFFLYDTPATPDADEVCLHPVASLFKTLPGLRRELGAVELCAPVELVVNEPDTTDLLAHTQWVARVRGYLGRGDMISPGKTAHITQKRPHLAQPRQIT